MKIDKYYLSLAGEYRVCSELLKRGLFAIVAFGNMKGTDIIAKGTNRRTVVVEVKASNSNRFVTGFYQKYGKQDIEHPDFWVLYSVQGEDISSTERFFVLSHDELANAQKHRNFGDEELSFLECANRSAGGVDNVVIEDVRDFENQWNKIVAGCSEAAVATS